MKIIGRKKEWEKFYNTQITIRKKIKKNKGSLKFKKRYIENSQIAGQVFCERQVELKHILGEVETEQLTTGREVHGEASKDSKRVSQQERWEKIFTSVYLWVSESLFFADYKDVQFVFKPDRVLFERGVPKLLVEYKFSKYYNREPFKSQEIQLLSEGLFLNELGFNIDSLFYTIIIAPLKIEKNIKLLPEIPGYVYKKIMNNKRGFPTSFNDINGTNINAYVYQFELDIAKKNVDWALRYWKEEREAELTKNINKCRSCNYISGCERKNIISNQG
ncbi:hypothetical protein LCGC14_1902910 [marine sediment metagenome]|uniref:PD-(D/E)XK endonuclease-like domain-containing protein n=1 Tax=marine sediment metagenome TaxID=412755 RepID=A0A0F9GJA4_9ZZZZ